MKRDLILEDLVVKEATKLRKNATKEELAKLDITDMSGDSTANCIYGQMTGNCISERAMELIQKCATKVYKRNTASFGVFNNTLNGSPKKIEVEAFDRLDYYTSPIENLLFRYKKDFTDRSTKVSKLVKFLKGEIKELKF